MFNAASGNIRVAEFARDPTEPPATVTYTELQHSSVSTVRSTELQHVDDNARSPGKTPFFYKQHYTFYIVVCWSAFSFQKFFNKLRLQAS